MKKLLLILLLIPSVSTADFNSSAKGTTTANFLKLGVGARPDGMGGAFAAAADDATAMYWNPAGLARADRDAATFMHAPYLDNSYFDFVGYTHHWDRQAVGISAQYFYAGSIPETDANNAPLGTFTPNDLAISLGYAFRITEAGDAIGVVGKYINSTIVDSAHTFAADIGIQSRPYWDRLRLAFTTVNWGGKMKFDQESESLPLALRAGSALNIKPNWLATFDLVFPQDNSPYTALGTEYVWHPGSTFGLAGRLGYNSLTTGDISGVTGASFGFGLLFEKWSFDYAFIPYGGLGITQRISLSLKFGGSTEGGRILSSRKPNTPMAIDANADGLESLLSKDRQ